MIREILMYTLFVNLPVFFAQLYLYSYLFDFKDMIPVKKIMLLSVLISLVDGITKYMTTIDIHTFVSVIFSIIILWQVLKIRLSNAIVSYLIATVCLGIMNALVFFMFIPFGINSEQITNDLYYSALFGCLLVLFSFIITLILKKTNKSLKWFRVDEFLSKINFGSKSKDQINFYTPLFIVFFIIITFGFTALYYGTVNKDYDKPSLYFTLIFIACILFSYIYIRLIRQVKEYIHYKQMYEIERERNK